MGGPDHKPSPHTAAQLRALEERVAEQRRREEAELARLKAERAAAFEASERERLARRAAQREAAEAAEAGEGEEAEGQGGADTGGGGALAEAEAEAGPVAQGSQPGPGQSGTLRSPLLRPCRGLVPPGGWVPCEVAMTGAANCSLPAELPLVRSRCARCLAVGMVCLVRARSSEPDGMKHFARQVSPSSPRGNGCLADRAGGGRIRPPLRGGRSLAWVVPQGPENGQC